LPLDKAEELLVGVETADDAAVYKLNRNLALVQTVDFFTPIVDDPYLFGQISAANALSDIYAMGGRPLIALSLIGYPTCLSLDVIGEILRGGINKVHEAGALMVGGHTVENPQPIFGLAATGIIDPKNVVTNANARPKDLLVLTKPLGIGILATALKGQLIEEEEMSEAIDSARELNKYASEAMLKVGVNACTDITGFGLLGHLQEMLHASNAAARIVVKDIPIWPKALEFAESGIIPARTHENRQYLQPYVSFAPSVKLKEQDVLLDPQTSGGLLISVSPERRDDLIKELKTLGVKTHAIIGEIVEEDAGRIDIF